MFFYFYTFEKLNEENLTAVGADRQYFYSTCSKTVYQRKSIRFRKKPIENITVYLLKAKDSSIVNYTATNKEGKFSLKIDEQEAPSILKIDNEKLSYSRTFEKIDKPLLLGDIEPEPKK